MDAIETPNPEYTDMLPAWELIDALNDGTAAMKEAGVKYLPKEEVEKMSCYRVRLERSVLFERLSAAIESLSGRPFAKPVQVQGAELPERLARIPDGVDDEGRDLTAFCQYLLEIALRRGLVHVLVDYPAESASDLGRERELELRPLLLAIDPKDLFGWKYERGANGRYTLTQVRIAETAEVATDDGYAVERRKRIRVIDAATEGRSAQWELWEQKTVGAKSAWNVIGGGQWTVGKITLVTIYLHKTGFMTAKSPLESLAWLNLAHWQAMSDYLNNARFASARIYFGAGMSDEDAAKPLVVGANQKFFSKNPEATLGIVESNGATLAAAEAVLKHLEEQMDAVAKGPLIVRASGNITATGEAINEGKGQCELQAWVHRLETGVGDAFALAGEWVGEQVPDDFGVDIYDDFGMLARSESDLNHIEQARSRGDLDLQTYLEAFKLRGLFTENEDIEQIMERIEQEGPGLGMMGRALSELTRAGQGTQPEEQPQGSASDEGETE